MKMAFYGGFAGILLLTLTGCITAGIIEPKTPMKEQALVVTTGSMGGGWKIDGNDFTVSLGRANTVIPSGKHTVTIESSGTGTLLIGRGSGNVSTMLQFPYTETWTVEYDFKPGKSYKFKQNGKHAELAAVYTNNGNTIVYDLAVPDIYVELEGPSSVNSYSVRSIRLDSGAVVTLEETTARFRIKHDNPDDIEIIEYNGGPLGSIAGGSYIGPYFDGGMKLGLWQYGPGFFATGISTRLGMQVIHGGLAMTLTGELGGEGFLAMPGFEKFGFGAAYSAGGLAEFYFSKGGIGIGGGITQGLIYTLGSNADDAAAAEKSPEDILKDSMFFFPYVELDLFFPWEATRKRMSSDDRSLYFQYYFNDAPDWYNKVGVGIKLRL